MPPLPFLHSQKLYVLRPEADPRAVVRNRSNERDRAAPSTLDQQLWKELPRESLLSGHWNGRSLHRVALTTDAGIGKTYNLRWLCYELNTPRQSIVAFTIPIGSLTSVANFVQQVLVPLVQGVPRNHDTNADQIHRELLRKRDAGRIVLLLDGLDQASDASVEVLAQLLNPAGKWANCRIVVTGRPFAIDQHWHRLFERNPKTWQFIQIGEFEEKQQREALGKLADGRDRFDAISREARSLFTVPRVLEYIRSLPEAHLTGLNTVADVYWQATGYMLTQAIGGRPLLTELERYRALLGALAFGIYCPSEAKPSTGPLRPNLDGVRASDMSGFLSQVYSRLHASFQVHGRGTYSTRQFEDDCRALSDLNAILNHGWLDVNTVGDPKTDLLWRNASLQEFFAASWATRWATPADLVTIRDWLVNPLTGTNSGFYWFWRYATEMPDAVLNTERPPRITWVKAMAPLYDQTEIRSTEFIYRSWNRMTETRSRWNAAQGTHPQTTFLGEFQNLHAGKRGTPRQGQIAREIMAGFEPLVETDKLGDIGIFWKGSKYDNPSASNDDNPWHRVTLKPFRIHRCYVTIVEYQLFDRTHPEERWKERWKERWGERWEKLCGSALLPEEELCDADRLPVVNVTWYDAWCFARWCGAQLPTEEQWEYAGRAMVKTRMRFEMRLFVWEWCENVYLIGQMHRNLHRCCWGRDAWYRRPANRGWNRPSDRVNSHYGFRLCLPGPD